MTLLKMEDVSLSLGGKRLLTNVNCQLEAGEIKGLIGPNGAGKSLFVKIAATAILKGVSGSVFIDSLDTLKVGRRKLRRIRRKIGYQPQMLLVDPDTSVVDQLRLTALVRGVKTESLGEQVQLFLELFGLKDRASKLGRELNGGSKVRLSLALASIGLPNESLFLADEPTAPLSTTSAKEIRECLTRLGNEFGHGILVVSHNLVWMEALTEKALFIRNQSVTLTSVPEFLRKKRLAMTERANPHESIGGEDRNGSKDALVVEEDQDVPVAEFVTTDRAFGGFNAVV